MEHPRVFRVPRFLHSCGGLPKEPIRSVTRLKLLRQNLGRHPAELRHYSTQFERIEESLSDPRARNTYRKGAVYDDDPGEDLQE